MPHTWQSARIPGGKRDTKNLLAIDLTPLLQRQRAELVNMALQTARKNLRGLGTGTRLGFLDPLENSYTHIMRRNHTPKKKLHQDGGSITEFLIAAHCDTPAVYEEE